MKDLAKRAYGSDRNQLLLKIQELIYLGCMFLYAQSICTSLVAFPSFMLFIFMLKLILCFALILFFRWCVFFILMVLHKATQDKQVLELCLWLKMVEWYSPILSALENLSFAAAPCHWFYVPHNLEDISTSWGSWCRY